MQSSSSHRTKLVRTNLVAALALLGAAACGDGTDGVTAPAALQRSAAAAQLGIALGADANPVSVARGRTATVNVRVARLAGFAGAVTLAADTAGLPRGLRVSIANPSVAAGDTAARAVTITADSTAAVTTTPTSVRISASAAGVSTQTLLLGVTITDQPAGFTVALAGTATGATVQAGQSGTVRLVVRRQGGFTGPVTFTADSGGLPAGVRVTQGATAGDTVTLTVDVAAGTGAGSYTLNLRGSGAGVSAQPFPLSLTVQPVGTFTLGTGAPVTVTAAQGTTVIVPVRITRQGGFGGRLSFLTTGPTPGLTIGIDSTATTGTTDSTVAVRITVPAATAVGAYTFTLRGVTAGLAEQSVPFTVNVTAAGTGGSSGFTFGTPTIPLIVGVGATSTVQLPITRAAGFADSLVISATGLPAGATLRTPTVRGTESTASLTLTTEQTLAPGTYPITLSAVGANGVVQTFTTTLTVVGNNPSFGFVFQLPQPTVTVQPGATTTAPLNVVRIATLAPYAVIYPQTPPRGFTVTLDRTLITGTSTLTATITASSDVRPGTYAITFTGATERGPIPPVTLNVRVAEGGTVTTTTTTGGAVAGALR